MSADFFKKKFGRIVICFLAIFATACGLFYAWQVKTRVQINTAKQFYFLVDTSVNVQASTYGAQSVGGAGYLLTVEKNIGVAYSVYFTEEESQQAKNSLQTSYANVSVWIISAPDIYLKKRKAKALAEKIEGAFESFYNNMQVLNAQTSRLEDGGTQQSCVRILNILASNFAYLGLEYKTVLPAYAKRCDEVGSVLRTLTNGIIYVRELRYLLCELCVSYVQFCEEYS